HPVLARVKKQAGVRRKRPLVTIIAWITEPPVQLLTHVIPTSSLIHVFVPAANCTQKCGAANQACVDSCSGHCAATIIKTYTYKLA
ncbi:8346_t:CDS:2, partial [Dentiscutata erythropus]